MSFMSLGVFENESPVVYCFTTRVNIAKTKKLYLKLIHHFSLFQYLFLDEKR